MSKEEPIKFQLRERSRTRQITSARQLLSEIAEDGSGEVSVARLIWLLYLIDKANDLENCKDDFKRINIEWPKDAEKSLVLLTDVITALKLSILRDNDKIRQEYKMISKWLESFDALACHQESAYLAIAQALGKEFE